MGEARVGDGTWVADRGLWYNVRVPRHRRARPWAAAGTGLAVALSGAAVARAWRPERTTADIALTAAAPWLLAPSWGLLAGALLARRRALAGLAVGLAAFQAWCARPRPAPARATGGERGGRGGRDSRDGPDIRLVFANVWCHNRDVTGVLGEVAAGEHDIVALAEVTEEYVPLIEAALPASAYPWRRLEPVASPGSRGLALLSRVPLAGVEVWSSRDHPQLDAVVAMDGAVEVRLLVVHTWGPMGRARIRDWRAQLAEIGERAGPRAAHQVPAARAATTEPGHDRPTLIVGDFNATRQHRSFDLLVGQGWSDAGSSHFGGWRATWPANRGWRPPLFRIDHILAGPGISVLSGRAGRARGSDHRPVTAVVRLPANDGRPIA